MHVCGVCVCVCVWCVCACVSACVCECVVICVCVCVHVCVCVQKVTHSDVPADVFHGSVGRLILTLLVEE